MLTLILFMLASWSSVPVLSITDYERLQLKHEAEDMFYHAYNAYMDNAFPADELMPLSCKGRFRGREPSRGDIDDAMGNFSLTLIDSLDMLVVVGDLKEFESAVRKVIQTVKFDTDVVVSVFETNIRIIGGLVSGHILSELLQSQPQHGVMTWYRGELLNLALDCANRLLPAFNSSTGLPYPRVNLRTGLRGLDSLQQTCTACAGSMILEFAALSRLTGEKVYEEKAGKAMDVLWAARHRQSNLVGNVLNVNTGDWIRRDSGVGAGIDSYYEYVAKAYVLLGEDKYLERWHSHYSAVMKYLGTGPLMMDVHMHRPNTNSKHFVDALGAFWPGLQVLMGDLKPAIEQHEVLYQIMKRHNFLPEAVTADFQVHWGQHLLRPEFVESTYFLYKATKDPYYLEAGRQVLNSLQKYARVTCGYAAVRDVRTLQHEDRMDSFVISETFKYLYLLFAEEADLFLDISKFVFTTEAHLLPLSLARLSNTTVVPRPDTDQFWEEEEDEEVDYAEACPSSKYLFPAHSSLHDGAASLRKPLESLVEDTCPTKKVVKRKLTAGEFQSTSEEHQKMVKAMGISIIKLPDGRVQLLHTFANAESAEDGEEGLLFMQEMIELSKQTAPGLDSPPRQISFTAGGRQFQLQAGPAQFGRGLAGSPVTASVVLANHLRACGGSLQNGDSMWGKIVIVERGDCMFVEKGRVLQSLGAVGGIVMDNTEGTAAATSPLFAMSGDGVDDVQIPMVFLFMEEAKLLMKVLAGEKEMKVTLQEKPETSDSDFVSKSTPEDPDNAEEENDDILNPAEKLKTAVHSFLRKSASLLQGNYEDFYSEVENKTEKPDTDAADADTIDIEENQVTGEVIATTTHVVKGEDGSTSTIKTKEKFKNGKIQEKTIGTAKLMKIGKLLKEETPVTDTEDNVEFDGLNDMVEPFNQIAQKAFREAAKNNPESLSELSKLDLSDLIKVFSSIYSKTTDVEDAYRQVLKGVQELGAKKFVEQFSDIEVNESDSPEEKGYLQGLEKIVKSMKSNPEVFSKMDNSQLHHLVKEYLTEIYQSSESRQKEDQVARDEYAAP